MKMPANARHNVYSVRMEPFSNNYQVCCCCCCCCWCWWRWFSLMYAACVRTRHTIFASIILYRLACPIPYDAEDKLMLHSTSGLPCLDLIHSSQNITWGSGNTSVNFHTKQLCQTKVQCWKKMADNLLSKILICMLQRYDSYWVPLLSFRAWMANQINYM